LEFLRFGSSIPGTYWGCCCGDIIQNFNVDPDAKTSIQLVSGDGGSPLKSHADGLFAGPTYRDIFWQRIRFGTFDSRDMPNHFFLAVITRNQLNGKNGKEWLAILKSAGFEFIRTMSNSVGQGQSIIPPGTFSDGSLNYVFGMFRNIGVGAVKDPYTPPPEWTTLPDLVPEAWQSIGAEGKDMVIEAQEAQLAIWNDPEKQAKPLMTRTEVLAAGAPVVLAGKRSLYKQQTEAERELVEKTQADKKPVVSLEAAMDAANTLVQDQPGT
jgi:hypothetical protein